MAATTSQGKSFTVFVAGITVAAAGLAFSASGIGKVALVAGLAIIGFSFFRFFRIKPLEGPTAEGKQPAALKLAGLALALGGWLVVLVGLHLTPNVTGRMVSAIVGLAISLFGVLVILPAAANKNAIWKA
ncbi:MAG TPA: hypothetical protein VGL00_07365 [Terracidiphilus sp.]|jgi:hypothetical protein